MTEFDTAVEELIEQFDAGGLSRGEAEAYVLREVLGQSSTDAGDQLEKTESTVESLLSRARRKIEALETARERAAEMQTE